MKLKIWTILILNLIICNFYLSAQQPLSNTSLDKKVANLVSKMTLEEKVGQMTQLSMEIVCKGYPNTANPLEINMTALRDVLVKHHIGSILNVGTSAHSVGRWQKIITTIQDVATKETRLGIPIIYGIDAIHGAAYIKDATVFPQNIAMAATWNTELMKKNGDIRFPL